MAERRLVGRPAAAGFAAGPLAPLVERVRQARAAGTPEAEQARLTAALAQALVEVERQVEAAEGDGADILAFQAAMLEDPELAAPAFAALTPGVAAEAAWSAALADQIADYESADDPHFRARASDLADIRDRVLGCLAGAAPEDAPPPGAILYARDLSPSRFLSVDWSRGGGIALAAGSAHGHVATLARARGVPMVVGLGLDPAAISAGAALLDGERAELWLDADPLTRAAFAARAASADDAAAGAADFLNRPARTQDGVAVAVLINLGSPAELDGLDPALCDGVGLVRTEFLFESGRELPDEEAQFQAYARIVRWAAGRPVTIRTLDAGGDKPIPGLTIAGESNPFLGLRGIRLSLARPDVLRPQLRALLRAAALGAVEIMLPMVARPQELEDVSRILGEEAANLGLGRPPLGIMVETPAAAVAPDLFAADFYSIGSNDLTQYVLAAARDSEAVADLYDPAHPAVLRLIAGVAAQGAARGVKVSLCGDAGADPRLIEPLLRAGLRALSVPPAAVARVKQAIASLDLSQSP